MVGLKCGPPCLVHHCYLNGLFHCSYKDYAKKQVGEDRVSFIILFYITGKIRAGTQGRKLKAGIEAEDMEDIAYCRAPCGLLNLLPHSIQAASLGKVLPIVSLALSRHTSHELRKCTIDLHTGKSDGDIFSQLKKILLPIVLWLVFN